MKTAKIFRAANNDGTGREDWHVDIREDGESVAVYGGFRRVITARECAKEHGATVTMER